MSSRASSWLAWSLAGLSLTMLVAGVALTLLFLSGAPDTRPSSTWGTVGALLGGGLFLVFPLVGALIASRRPENAIGWICLAVGLLCAHRHDRRLRRIRCGPARLCSLPGGRGDK
jgi:MFS-type transporter involved in bile tolerance (Atg22 family)